MQVSAKKFYSTIILLLLGGLVYLSLHWLNSPISAAFTCWFKLITHIPCPACGTTRAIIDLWMGNFSRSLLINPLGIISVIAICCTIVMLLLDAWTKRTYTYKYFKQTEALIKHPYIAISLILLIFANWMWNIEKGI